MFMFYEQLFKEERQDVCINEHDARKTDLKTPT